MESKKRITFQSDEVHIWSACLSDNEIDINYFISILSQDEYERANNFKFPKNKKQFTIARGILRCLLANYLGVSPQSIKIAYGLWGKPRLSQEGLLHFNVSHSGDYALYALTLNFEVGIDLEHINNTLNLEDIALSIFSPAELFYWRNLNHQEQINYFFNFWVCKEAFLKALGKGWLEKETKILFTEFPNFKKSLRDRDLKDEPIYPYCIDLLPEYASAIFVNGPFLRLLHYDWNTYNSQKDFL